MSKSLCYYAFEVINHKLTHKEEYPLERFAKFDEDFGNIPKAGPLFVTWNQYNDLRGCIGTFQEYPIQTGVSRFSLTSAFHDDRFPPIELKELPSLLVNVTLLANFELISRYDDWNIGIHGLKLSIDTKNHYSGTFLPSVAEEQNWDKITTLYYLLKKADVPGVLKKDTLDFYETGIKSKWLKLTRYEGLKDTVAYDEYREIRKRIEEEDD